MATPVVSGAAALLLQANPNLTPDTIKARLMFSADKWAQPNGTGDPCTYGAGYLNIPAALQCTAVPTQPALSPQPEPGQQRQCVHQHGSGAVGNRHQRQRALWGTTGVTDLRALWGTRALWSTSTNVLNASRALWGTSVWSDRALWGTTTSSVDLTSTAINGE